MPFLNVVEAIIAEEYRGKAVKAMASLARLVINRSRQAMCRVTWEARHSDRRRGRAAGNAAVDPAICGYRCDQSTGDVTNSYCRNHRNVQVRWSTSCTAWRALMSTGTVKWFNPTKGYGFIQPQGGGGDVFVHISAVEKAGLSTLNEGQQVEFEIVSNRGKSSAENLKVK
jgi:CspA family cold shock protein